jgi:hypothetical protein
VTAKFFGELPIINELAHSFCAPGFLFRQRIAMNRGKKNDNYAAPPQCCCHTIPLACRSSPTRARSWRD